MKILVVGGHSAHNPETEQMRQYAEFFQTAARRDDPMATAEFCFLDELAFWVTSHDFVMTDTRRNVPVDTYDLIVLRGQMRPYLMLAYCVSRYATAKGIPFCNDYSLYRPSSKLAQMIAMRELGLPIPATLACDNPAQLLRCAEQYLQFPLIAKDTYGSHGANNFLVHSRPELGKILDDYANVSFVLQEFVPNDSDYRILVVGNRHLIIKRQATGDSHLNNTSQGGTATMVEAHDFPAEALAQAHRLASELDMDIAGVDAMHNKNTGELVFLEVNSQPQLLTGALVDQKAQLIADYVRDKSRAGR